LDLETDRIRRPGGGISTAGPRGEQVPEGDDLMSGGVALLQNLSSGGKADS
jgi:hypothetical protein